MIRRLTLCAFVALAALPVLAQTAPPPHALAGGDYAFAAWASTQAAGTYPASMRFHRSTQQDPLPTDAFAADYTGAYNLTAGTRLVGLGENGIGFLNTGTAGTLGAATVALNTTGLANVRVAWTGGTVVTGTRPYVLRLQWRVGAGGAYTDAGTEYVASGTAGHAQTFSTTLPAAAGNQPLVFVRWVYAQTATGAGTRPQLRLDDVLISASDSPASGTGTATFSPATVQATGAAQTVTLRVAAVSDAPADRLTHVTFTLPDAWPEATSVTVTPAGAAVETEGRTVRVSGLDASQSASVDIAVTVALPAQSGFFAWGVRTGAGSAQTVALGQQPALAVWTAPEAIAAVRANNGSGVATRLGEYVTVRGVVTASDEFATSGGERGPSFFEDATGGLAAFSPVGLAAQVETGDEVVVMGRVDQFFGLNQLNNETVVVQALGQPGAEPTTVTLSQIATMGASEAYEGRLVRVAGVTVNTTVWNAEGAGTNYLLTDATGTLDVRINPATDLTGQPAPTGPFDLIGVVSQFRVAAPYIGGYQILPRSLADVIPLLDAPTIAATAPFETAATPTSVTVRWTTSQPAHSEVRYVARTGATGAVVDETRTTDHVLTLTDLRPATVYTLDLRSAADADTARVSGYPVATRSAPGTTGTMEAYFNQTVDTSVATGSTATQIAFAPELISRIATATETLDVALYSLSGSAGSSIATALIAARDRGVRVRVIMDDETSSTAPPEQLRAAGIPLITDGFGNNDGAAGLHHNKVVVADAYAVSPTAAWVMTGSWNPSDPGTNDHQQNVIYVQDGALAAAYTAEFEQMWGSSTATPDAAQARFHGRKTVVAPSVFWIGTGDAPVYTRLLFSPQGFGAYGSVEAELHRTLQTADAEIALNLNLITRQPTVDVIAGRISAGVTVRGVVGEITTTGSVFLPLAAIADVLAFPSDELGLLHHKTAIVDAQTPQSDPTVITGSHNWSRSANESNNENTLFIHSARLANEYLQEFVARYREAGGTAQFPTGAEAPAGSGTFALSSPWPNPTTGAATVALTLPEAGAATVRVFNVLGQEVARVAGGAFAAGRTEVALDTRSLAAGVYLVRAETAGGGRTQTATQRLTVVR